MSTAARGVPGPGPPSRVLALLVAALFGISPVAIWAVLPSGQDWTWPLAVLGAAYIGGAAVLGIGAGQWYGPAARRLRLVGFTVLLLAGLANVSLAFALVPLALLASFSLRQHDDVDQE